MALSETLDCIYSSSEEENAVSIEENKDLPKSAKKKKLMDSPKKTDEPKKTAFKDAATYKSMYKRDRVGKYLSIAEANGIKYAFYCIPCKRNITCHHMGLGDATQHCRTPYHKTMEKSVKNTCKVNSFFTSTASDEVNDSVIRAKALHTNFIVQHNLSFLTADHLAPMYSKIFPYSKKALKFIGKLGPR